MYQEVNTRHLLFRDAHYPEEIQKLNQVYAKLPFIPHFIFPELERLKYSVRGHLLKTNDGYVWKHGLIGKVIGNFGEEIGIMLLFPQKIMVNYVPTLERSIAIFGQHPFDFGYRNFLLDLICKLKIFSVKHEIYREMALKGFFSHARNFSQYHFCEICRQTKKESDYLFSDLGAIHLSCAVDMSGRSSIF